MTRVLVTGVRGKTGAPLARLLVARGVEVRGGSSDPDTVTAPGVDPIAFSWDAPAGWPQALAGVDAVYVVRPDRPDAPELVGALVAAVAPTARVVLLSERDTEHLGPDAWAMRVERVVRGGPRAWTILRPSWFMQVLTDPRFYRGPILDGGELPFPSGGAGVAWIDARDIAAVAERALLEDGHKGKTYELTGPDAVSLPHTADLLSHAVGHTVTHRDSSIEEAVAGTTGFERDLSVVTFERVRDGRFAEVTDDVERVLGVPPRSLAAFLADAGTTLGAD
ncbi:NAD(P)H-binding protein [Nocardioides sp. dk4132]|uniref:NAD(P)H-binding protein n=1 Tax=unclassified Nocardioides TaxID=2615069 RepID=UPI001295BAEB|nr:MULTISPECIES: NAD(P)H-binding protein [unclassified Nocardioides]MQW74884.1 NAD(P)H-binding protein [Nocardioides sp. dk4132]QGA07925.1 NAD(P)H-binding protein [Nocardioides sp. dk884]